MDENILEGLEALEDEGATEEVVETDETLNEEDGIVDEDIEIDEDDGLLGELDADIPDVSGSVTLNCTSCSALYLQLIGDPDDDQDQMFAKSITEMTATCPQCGELTRQVVVSAPLTAPEPVEEPVDSEGKTKLLSATLDRMGVRQYGKSPSRIQSCADPDPQINSSMMTKVQSNVEGGVGSFRRFVKNDWNGYAGADKLPDGTEPLIHSGDGADIIVSGVDGDKANVQFIGVIGDWEHSSDEFCFSRDFGTIDQAVRLGEKLVPYSRSGVNNYAELDDLSTIYGMEDLMN
jgi:hypothetical protein